MKIPYLIVDGSNIATEGRSLPSLRQLEEAVAAFQEENDVGVLTVIVDATFGHRIDKDEVKRFDEAVSHNEITTPPAGVIGRGDAFILQVADKAKATILSNDSYQEFHPEYRWLFDEGRLIGGKPVPGIGWVFTARVPVRGPVSRKAMKAAKTAKSSRPRSTVAAPTGRNRTKERGGRSKTAAKDAKPASRSKQKEMKETPVHALNEPLPFIQFVSEHPVGTTVVGEVERFSSHGAYVNVSGAHCYVPLKSMGEPAPRRARDVLRIGESREFEVVAIDTPRRGIDLALVSKEPALVDSISDRPPRPPIANERETTTDVLQDGFAREEKRAIGVGREAADDPKAIKISSVEDHAASAEPRRRARKANTDAPLAVTKDGADHPAQEAPVTPVKKAAKKSAKKAAKKSPARKAAKKAAKRTTKKAAKKRTAKKAAKKATKKSAKKAAKKRPAKKAAKKRPAKKAAKKRTAKKAAKKR